MKEQILNWNIDKKLCSITTDNASNNFAMIRELKLWLCGKNFLLSDGRCFHVQCSAHILNLIVQDGLNVISDLLRKIRASVRHVKSSPSRYHKFQQVLHQEKLMTKKGLNLDVSTRWNSTYLMLGSALELRRAFERLADFDQSYSNLPTSEEWDVGSRVHGCLKVFYEATTSLSGSKYVTANLYFHDVCDVHIHLLEWLNDGEHLYIQRMATTMMLKFQKYWEDCSLILTVALVLDPRFKMEYVDYTYRQLYGDGAAFIHTERVRSYLYELYSEYAANSGVYHVSDKNESTHGDDMFESNEAKKLKSGFKKFMSERTTLSSRNKSELDLYLEETIFPDESGFNLLFWWRSYGTKFPILSKMARDILAVPVSSVASESAFSTGGRVLDEKRISLLPETVEALVCGQDWLVSNPKN